MISLVDFFLCFSILSSSLLVLWNNDIVISMLNLILVFFGFTCFLVKLGLGFIGFLLFIVYVGAVAILFLFSVVMLGGSERVLFLNSSNLMWFFLGFLFLFVYYFFWFVVLFGSSWPGILGMLDSSSGLALLGQSFFLFYSLPVLVGGVLLLLGLFGGVGLSRP